MKETEEEKRKRLIRSRLLKNGTKEKDSNAILANIAHETGGSFDPKQKQIKGPAQGLVQWEGSRLDQLKTMSKKQGKDPMDLNTQVDFINSELNTTERIANRKLKKAGSLADKTKSFSDNFERPGKPHMEHRLKEARKLEIENIAHTASWYGGTSPEQNAETLKKQDMQRSPQSISSKVEGVASSLIKSAPLGQNLSTHQKKNLQREVLNPDNVTEAATASQASKQQGNKPSVKSEFMEALGFFLPSIAGLVVGGAIGGAEGAVEGADLGMKAGNSFIDRKLAREKFEFSKKREPNPIEQQRLEVSQGNLELRKKQLEQEKIRTGNLEEDRDIRQNERDTDRAIRSKESFAKRGDVKKLQEQGLLLTDINNIINDAPEIASGVIGFKIAKGIAGEVGNLTQAEREDAQVSPSFYRKMKRGGTNFLMGRLPKEDVTELNKVVKILEKRRKQKMTGIVDGFTRSRSKSFSKDIAKEFSEDLKNEYGLEEKSASKNKSSSDKFSSWDEEKKKRYLQFKANRGSK